MADTPIVISPSLAAMEQPTKLRHGHRPSSEAAAKPCTITAQAGQASGLGAGASTRYAQTRNTLLNSQNKYIKYILDNHEYISETTYINASNYKYISNN